MRPVELQNDGRASARSLGGRSRTEPSLAERVERALRATGYPALRTIDVSVRGRLVVLQGRVPSYYMKQMAQAIAMAIPAVQELRNDVDVVSPAAWAATSLARCSLVSARVEESHDRCQEP
jgi:osmotically-inducible protein OsmY